MASYGNWINYTQEIVTKNIENDKGVYQIADSSNIIYIGEGRVQSRLLDHLRPSNGNDYFPDAKSFRFRNLGFGETSLRQQNIDLFNYKKEFGRLPKYNDKIG